MSSSSSTAQSKPTPVAGTANTSSSSQFSTCRILFSQRLSQLVQSLENQSDTTTTTITDASLLKEEVKRVVQDSFGFILNEDQDQETSEVPNWKLDTRRVVIERALDELVQEAVTNSLSLSLFRTESHQKFISCTFF